MRTVAVLLTTAFFAFSQTGPLTQGNADRINSINQQINAQPDAAMIRGLLAERAGLLADLMEKNPRAAVESALPDELRRDLAHRVPGAEALLEKTGEWTGPLVTTVADDFKHARSRVSRVIHLEDRAVDLFWNAPADVNCSPSATVRGIRLGDRIAADSGKVTANSNSPCSSTGDQKTVVLLLSYPSTPITPGYTQSFVNSAFFGSAPSLTDYWREASYGKATASGDVFGPFTLKADYTCGQTDAILQAAIQAADSTVDFTAYTHIFLILPVTVSQYCGWDGLAQLGCSIQQSPSKGPFTASVSWIQALSLGPNIYGLLGEFLQTVIHEGGHNFGLRHASSIDFDTLPAGPPGTDGNHSEYGDPFSSMGYNPGHFAAPHKNQLGWLNQGTGWQQVQSGGTWTLAPLSQQSGSPQALRVQRGSSGSQWLWIEYRQPIGPYEPTVLDNGAPRNFGGALIHFEDPGQPSWSGYTELLDFQPVRTPNNFNSAMMQAGSVWADPYSNLTLTAGSATPAGIAITVSYDNGCATLSPASRSHGALADSGSITVSAAPGCSWTAVTSGEWITFTGAISGTGPGTVSYSVSANSSTAARTAIISISHQTFTVTQAAPAQGGSVSVAPPSGTGASQAFNFVFTDPVSFSNLTSGEIIINTSQVTSNACYIHWNPAAGTLSLRDDAGDAWLTAVPIGGSGSLSNTQCVLFPGSASVTAAGTSVTLSLTIDFTNRFANSTKNVYMEAQSIATSVGWQQAGTWTVPFAFSPVSVSPNAGSGYTQLFTFTLDGLYSGDEVNFSFSTSTAMGTLQFFDNGCAVDFSNAASPDFFMYGDVYTTGSNGTLGTGPSLQNSQCILNTAASSAVLSGTTLTVKLAITFKTAFIGQKNIYAWGPGTGYPDGASNASIGTYTVTAAPSANTSAVTIQTNPPGLQFSVDGGAAQTAPQTLSLTAGSHTIATPTSQAGSPGTQYVFSAWSDGGAASHSVTVGSSAATYTASFQTQYQLSVAAAPAAGGTITPQSGGYYTAGTSVQIAASPNSGYSFGGWNGTVASANAALTTITLASPQTVTANFTLTQTAVTPVINPAGIVPLYSSTPVIQPGSWVSIYGTNLSASTAHWNADFPTSLGGVSVTVNGKPGYLLYVSPEQVIFQSPNDTTQGVVPVILTTPYGIVASSVTLAPFGPSFSLIDSKHVTGIIPRSDGSGAYGSGTPYSYDIIGPTGKSLGFPTVAARAGDTIVLFAVGLGPTNSPVPAGKAFSGAAATTSPVNLLIDGVSVTPAFAGLSSAGLYQINLTVPGGLDSGDVSLVAIVDGVQTPSNVVIALQ